MENYQPANIANSINQINTHSIRYGGGRTEPYITNWVKKRTSLPYTIISSEETLTEFIDWNNVVCIGKFANLESESAQAFISTSIKIEDVPFAIITEENVGNLEMETGNVNFENESVVLFKDFDEKYNIYKKEENLVEFVNRNKLG